MRDLLWQCDEHRGPYADFPAVRGKRAPADDRSHVRGGGNRAIGLATSQGPRRRRVLRRSFLGIDVVGRAGPRPRKGCRQAARDQRPARSLDRRGSSFGPLTHGLDDLGVVDPRQVSRGDRKVRVPELALDHEQRDPLTGHLHCMRVPRW